MSSPEIEGAIGAQVEAAAIPIEIEEPQPSLTGTIDLNRGEFGHGVWKPFDRAVVLNGSIGVLSFDFPFATDRHKPMTREEKKLLRDIKRAIWNGRDWRLSEMAEGITGHSYTVEGEENIPHVQNFILVSNHFNGWLLRTIGTQIAQNRVIRDLRGGGDKNEVVYLMGHGSNNSVIRHGWLRMKPFSEQIAQTSGQILVDRKHVRENGNGERKHANSLMRARELLKSGGLLGVYPEGTDHEVMQQGMAETGQFFLAVRHLGVPIVPLGVSSSDGIELSMKFGEPFQIPMHGFDSRKSSDGQKFVDFVMDRVAALVPEPQRGYYR